MERGPEPGRRRWSVYRTPRGSGSVESEPEAPTTPSAPTETSTTAQLPDSLVRLYGSPRRTTGLAKVIAGVVVVGAVGVVGVVAAAVAGDDGPFGDSEVQVLTEDGMSDFVDAVEEKTGRTEAFSTTIYPTYAVVRVPVDDSSQRYIGYYWDGHDLEEWAGKGTSTDERFDLADLDTSVLLPLVKQAKAQVEDPNSWYVIIDHGTTDTEDGWISAYASNEYSEGGYIEVDLEGNEIRRTTWPTEP